MKEPVGASAPSSPPKTTNRVPGRWAELTVSGNELVPEISTTLPWLSAEEFEHVVHQAAEGTGFSFEHDVERRPDFVLGERDIGLDSAKTRERLFLGIALVAAGFLVMLIILVVLIPNTGPIDLILLGTILASVAIGSGAHLATQSRWESDLLRVRLDPGTTRGYGSTSSVPGKHGLLSVRVFLGRVTSSSMGTEGGTIRSLQKVLPSASTSREPSEIASRLAELARKMPATASDAPHLRTVASSVSTRRRSPHLLPLVSKSGRPEWYDYPRKFVWLRVVALTVPMMLLIFGPFLMLFPWNYERVDFIPGGPSTQSIPGEAWSPTGATNGELWWYTYNPATSSEPNNVPVVVALCPVGTDAIYPSVCRPATGSSLAPLTYSDSSISIPAGWHVVANVNVSDICAGCHTSVRFSSPALALGLGVTLAGVAVLLPSVVLWLRIRANVKSAWPE
jgi:hypothetical protein